MAKDHIAYLGWLGPFEQVLKGEIAVLYDGGASTTQLGGCLKIVYFYPNICGNDPISLTCLNMEWLNHQLDEDQFSFSSFRTRK